MMNHEILERHESEESCDESISTHRAPCQCGHLRSELFFPFVYFVYFVVKTPGYQLFVASMSKIGKT